ncbi:uncharacterized protein J7T54_001521 [Emericellopsis cladophorae]|uniref:Uncharacterized protein n=1 Tax=Emericellopsis cladophorae TaxID=2686198 RepID=A0A9Q0BAX4_9HYPO|nr:uncharacterized protein J7T54_001521 [Emericellopsis cladophorae]KAI6778101.1 hypothetical protein J7T54_001521 [Emericellopsis cladophorae]
MLFSPAFFGLFAGASAIDIWHNWSSGNCHGSNSIYCANIGPNRRRSEGTGEECTDLVTPDIVAFTDGVQYDLTQLDDAAMDEMYV